MKKPGQQGKISINQLIEQVKKEKGLTRAEKFEKVVDIAFKSIYEVKTKDWQISLNKTELLTELAEREAKNSVYSRLNETIKNYL